MSAYETTVSMEKFRGINQSNEGDNLSLQFAVYAENCDTRGGDLKPMRRGVPVYEPALPAPIYTLARLYRRYHANIDSKELIVAVAGGKLYTRDASATGWTLRYSGILNNDFDYITYEVNTETSPTTIDVLIMSNVDDGMIVLYGNDYTIKRVNTPYKFGVLGRHSERIWGAGISNKPDTLVYSAPFNPFDWKQNNEHPEDGAGEISQPSWDGDRFLALRSYGSQLLAFKRNRLWRIMGTHPGDFVFKEQFGGGSIVENTIVVNDNYAFMLSFNGIMMYDGVSVSPFKQEEISGIWQRVNKRYISKAYGIGFNNVLYFALPLDEAIENNAVLSYDLNNHSFMLRTDTYVKSFMVYEDEMFYTSTGVDKGKVWLMDGGEALPVKWESGYIDLGSKNVVKSGFTIYLSIDAPSETIVRLSVDTEKKTKTKEYQAVTAKVKRLRIANSGRRFRLRFECDSPLLWKLRAGLQVQVELDED